MITILTPTYNRAHTLPRLYESLVSQTNCDFEWLVVDDGSIDNTEDLIKTFKRQASFDIRYIKKDNGGKHTALNLGFRKARRKWVLMLDSDDWLRADTIEFLYKEIVLLTKDFNSLSFLKVYENGTVVGDEFGQNINTYLERIYSNTNGDKADLIRVKALEGFSFPEYPGENFMAEAPLFLWLGARGKTHFVNYGGYFCEYLENGLSANSVKNRHRCFNSTLYLYELQYQSFTKHTYRIKAAINWWRFRFFKKSLKDNNSYLPIYYSPLGFIMYLNDKLKKRL